MRRSILKLSFTTLLTLSSLSLFGFTPPHSVDLKKSSFINRFKNWGLINNIERSHINAPEAWKIEQGNRGVVVAVIDTGIDPNHKDLAKNIWRNSKEQKPDVFGWNFVANKPNPYDDHGHGTHVAGIIGAISDPVSGISGVAHQVSIMPIKYYSDGNTGAVNLMNTIKAINYAVEHGAKIINYSGGGPEFSEGEVLALKKAEAQGILVVAAAGNEHQDTDLVSNYYYPAAYRLSNIISVAATDIHNNLLPTSNWGKKRVDVAAPGENIFSTLPGNRYGPMSGTSQATAFVTGIASLLLSQDPTLKPTEIREIIMSSVDRFSQLENKLVTGGRVNAYTSLLNLKDRGRPKSKNQIMAQRPTTLMLELGN